MQSEDKAFKIPKYIIWGIAGLLGIMAVVTVCILIFGGFARSTFDREVGFRNNRFQEFNRRDMMGFDDEGFGRGVRGNRMMDFDDGRTGMMGRRGGMMGGFYEAPYDLYTTPTQSVTDTVKSGLLKALDDEYKAYTTYSKIIKSLGDTTPFSNIVRAEENHIVTLQNLMTRYSVDYPVNPYKIDDMKVGATRVENCKMALDLENANVTMYDGLINDAKDFTEIAGTYDYLQNASKYNHIPALQRCIANQ